MLEVKMSLGQLEKVRRQEQNFQSKRPKVNIGTTQILSQSLAVTWDLRNCEFGDHLNSSVVKNVRLCVMRGKSNNKYKYALEVQNQKQKIMNPMLLSHERVTVQSPADNFLDHSLMIWEHQYCKLDARRGRGSLEVVIQGMGKQWAQG